MRYIFSLCLLGSCVFASAQMPSPLSLSHAIPLPGVIGRFDHLAIDTQGNRLFVAATGKHSVEVVNLDTDKIQQSISNLGKPHGLAWVAESGSLYVADGALGELRVYKGSPLTLAGTIKLSDDADDMVYDKVHRLLFVGYGGSETGNPAKVAVVDTTSFRLVASIAVASHPEALDIDPKTGRVFVNLAEANEVDVIGTASKAIEARWKLTKAADNVPMAFDGEHNLLYVACRMPGTILALNATTGKEVESLPTASGADDLFYDADLRRIYVINGVGEVDTYQVDEKEVLHPMRIQPTASGAKTALFVPAQRLLYVSIPGAEANPAEIRIYTTVVEKNN
jgi:DNA-binding beta-propeller fold protein YncE